MYEDIRKYHGEVRICGCHIYDPELGRVNPERISEKACRQCFARGFVAQCLNCDGKGQIEEKMAGGPGKMKSTCLACGGVGSFGVNKPDYWDDQHPKEAPAEAAAAEVA